jgi:exodeoxyribonuclease I
MSKTFLFYDIETSGLNKAFDQVLQFAAIRTDETLMPLETYEYLVKVSRDTLPDPEAILVHHLVPEVCAEGESEAEVIRHIHALMNVPGTVSLGYNTLGFDDEFLRFSFFRHLLTPYTHQYAEGCGRADLYPIVLLYYLFRHDHLNWPEVEGRLSMKLENLNKANQLASGRAHTALADVQATLALAQRLREDEAMWQYALGYFDKAEACRRIAALPACHDYPEGQLGVVVEGGLGAVVQFHAPVLVLGQHRVYRNQVILLRLDHFSAERFHADGVQNMGSCIMRKKYSESRLIIPFNRGESRWDAGKSKTIQATIRWCVNHPQAIHDLAAYYTDLTYPNVPECDASACLYQIGFPERETLKQYALFWTLTPQRRLDLVAQLPHHAQCCAERLLWRQDSALFEDAASSNLDQYCAKLRGEGAPLVDYRGQTARTAQTVRQRITELLDTASVEQKALLESYSTWLMETWQV